MPKNIVVCCDGTDNKFGKYNTNVVKLCEVLDRSCPEQQVVFYDPGVGTLGDQHALTRLKKWFTRVLGSAIGLGLRENVQEAYDFLAWHYQPGDRLFIFGFSRGAYTARAIASLIHMYGLTGPGSGNMTPYLMGMLANDEDDEEAGEPVKPSQTSGGKPAAADRRDSRNRWRTANSFKKIFGRRVQVDFVGVFDTVKSAGWLWNPLQLPWTASNPSVRCIRHAVSIDERRAFFRTNLLYPAKTQDFKEVWFAGVHSDIGGGYRHRDQGLAQIPFAWMVREARAAGLLIDDASLTRVLGSGKYTPPDVTGMLHNSLTWKWWVLELLPQPRPWRYTDANGKEQWQLPFRINFFRCRDVPRDARMHKSVSDRRAVEPAYRPGNLDSGHPYPEES